VRLVVDANVFISAFLKDGMSRRIILDRRLELYAPEFLLQEYTKYSAELFVRSGLPREKALRLAVLLLSRIHFVTEGELIPYKEAAKHLTTDSKDEAYVACALAVGSDLWSRDRHLRQPRLRCWATEELAEKLFGNG